MVLNYKGRNGIGNWTCINYLQYVQRRWGIRTPSMLQAGYPTLLTLEGEVRFDQAQDQQVVITRSPRIVTECLLTRSMLIKMYVGGLSGKFIDTACFHCFLYIFQTSFTYYNSVTQEWFKYKTGTVFCHIQTQHLLLWQHRVEVTGARQNFLNLKLRIYLSFSITISEL